MFYWFTKGVSSTLIVFTELTSVLIYRRMFLFIKINFAELHTKLVLFFPFQSVEVGRKKVSKSWRHPLNKPPARSPMTLVKQQATSDEGECSIYYIFLMIFFCDYETPYI